MDRFNLLSLNAFGTARGALSFLRWRGIEDAERLCHQSVHSLIAQTTIACFQEIFLSEAEEFFARLPHPELHADSNANELWPLTFGGSGLAIASHLRRVEGGVVRYSRPQAHAERFARKGMMHARLALGPEEDSRELDVLTTHLQAGLGENARRVRERQLRQLGDRVAELADAGRAFVVCGDFNVDALAEDPVEYRELCSALSGFEDLGKEANAPTFAPRADMNQLAYRFDAHEPVQRIDCIFFRPPADGSVVAEGFERVFDAPLASERPTPLFASDHYGVRASFRIAR